MEAQLLKWKQAISYQHDEPSHKEPLEPVWLAIVQLGPNGSTALEVKASHFISTWWAKPQGTSGTRLVGNTVHASVVCPKESSCKGSQAKRKKTEWMGGGFLIGGGTCFYLWGGHHSRGVAFLSSQKYPFQWYFNKKTISWEMFFFQRSALIFHLMGLLSIMASIYWHQLQAMSCNEHECMLDPMMIWSVAKKGHAQNEIAKDMRWYW